MVVRISQARCHVAELWRVDLFLTTNGSSVRESILICRVPVRLRYWWAHALSSIASHGRAWAMTIVIKGSLYSFWHVLLWCHGSIGSAEPATVCSAMSNLWVKVMLNVIGRRLDEFGTHVIELLVLEHWAHSSWVSTMLMGSFVSHSRHLCRLLLHMALLA